MLSHVASGGGPARSRTLKVRCRRRIGCVLKCIRHPPSYWGTTRGANSVGWIGGIADACLTWAALCRDPRRCRLYVRLLTVCAVHANSCRAPSFLMGPSCKRAYAVGLQTRAKVQTSLLSAKKPSWPEHENVRNESSGHREGAALAAFQCDLLGEHDVSDRQLAYRPETQAEPRAAFFVDLADVRHRARIDPVLLAGLATDDFEISSFRELRPLRRRQPIPQEPQGPALRSSLGAVSDEQSLYGAFARAFVRPRRREAQHGATDYPPTSLGKNTVSSAFGSNDRICET